MIKIIYGVNLILGALVIFLEHNSSSDKTTAIAVFGYLALMAGNFWVYGEPRRGRVLQTLLQGGCDVVAVAVACGLLEYCNVIQVVDRDLHFPYPFQLIPVVTFEVSLDFACEE